MEAAPARALAVEAEGRGDGDDPGAVDDRQDDADHGRGGELDEEVQARSPAG